MLLLVPAANKWKHFSRKILVAFMVLFIILVWNNFNSSVMKKREIMLKPSSSFLDSSYPPEIIKNMKSIQQSQVLNSHTQPIKTEERVARPINVEYTNNEATVRNKIEQRILRRADKLRSSASGKGDHYSAAGSLDSETSGISSVSSGESEQNGKIDYFFGETVETENGPIRIKHVPHDEKMQIQEAVQNSNRTIPLYPWKAICDERDDGYNKALHIFVMTDGHGPPEYFTFERPSL